MVEMPIAFALPASARIVFNDLYAEMPPDALRSDLVAVQLATGKWIDVSWHPQFDPAGEYHVTVFDDEFSEDLIAATTAKTPGEVAEVVGEWAGTYG